MEKDTTIHPIIISNIHEDRSLYPEIICKHIADSDPNFNGIEGWYAPKLMSEVKKFYDHAIYCHNMGMPTDLLQGWLQFLIQTDPDTAAPRYSIFHFPEEYRTSQFFPPNIALSVRVPYENLQERLTRSRRLSSRPEDVLLRLDRRLSDLICREVPRPDDGLGVYKVEMYTMAYFTVAMEYEPEFLDPKTLHDQYWDVILSKDFNLSSIGDALLNEMLYIARSYRKRR